MKDVNLENIKRFDGYSALYNSARPTPPEIITNIAVKYLGRAPRLVADIGSGTGLSALIWKDIAEEIIGIEPNDDMRGEAQKNIAQANISFRKGFSNDTGLPAESADIAAVSQAFHWFDIDSTLVEMHRILKCGGVLAVFDCDECPAFDWQVEKAYNELHKKCHEVCFKEEKHAVQNNKSLHLSRFNEFGRFSFTKEVVCHSIVKYDAERIKGFALSKGAMQTALKLSDDIKREVDAFCALVDERCAGEFDVVFSYRLRLAIK